MTDSVLLGSDIVYGGSGGESEWMSNARNRILPPDELVVYLHGDPPLCQHVDPVRMTDEKWVLINKAFLASYPLLRGDSWWIEDACSASAPGRRVPMYCRRWAEVDDLILDIPVLETNERES